MPTDPNAPTVVIKALAAFEIKDATKGEVEAVVATLGVVDRDRDIIKKGAIADGSQVVVSAYGHDAVFGNMPAGKGVLTSKGDEVVFKGRMFLGTTAGRESFEVMKEMGSSQEWSFGFRVLGEEVPNDDERKQGVERILTKLDAFEVSPVVIGAGIGTRTLAVKGSAAQADGADDPPAVDPAIAEAEATRVAAEVRAATEAAEVKAAHDAEVAAEIAKRAVSEFEHLQRTMRKNRA